MDVSKPVNDVILDDMQKIYPKLLEADVIILASPIFFYGVTAWAKALVDRCQALWSRKYLLKNPSLGKEGKRERGSSFLWEGQKGRGSLRERSSPPNIFSMSSMRNTLAN